MTTKFETYICEKDKLEYVDATDDASLNPVWIDVIDPTDEVIESLNERYSLKIPTVNIIRKGMPVPRFSAGGVTHMFTTNLLCHIEKAPHFNLSRVFYIIHEERMISLRFGHTVAHEEFKKEIVAGAVAALKTGPLVFFALMVHLASDYSHRMENMGQALNLVAEEVFAEDLQGQNSYLHKDQVNRIAEAEFVNSRIMNSLMGLSLLADYFDTMDVKDYRAERNRFEYNISSLIDSGQFVADRIDFVMNAVMSVISLEQNRVVNVFSVFTVIFTGPTLLAGVWGMNFQHMPELSWPYGYVFALIAMLLAGIVPYRIVKKMGWL